MREMREIYLSNDLKPNFGKRFRRVVMLNKKPEKNADLFFYDAIMLYQNSDEITASWDIDGNICHSTIKANEITDIAQDLPQYQGETDQSEQGSTNPALVQAITKKFHCDENVTYKIMYSTDTILTSPQDTLKKIFQEVQENQLHYGFFLVVENAVEDILDNSQQINTLLKALYDLASSNDLPSHFVLDLSGDEVACNFLNEEGINILATILSKAPPSFGIDLSSCRLKDARIAPLFTAISCAKNIKNFELIDISHIVNQQSAVPAIIEIIQDSKFSKDFTLGLHDTHLTIEEYNNLLRAIVKQRISSNFKLILGREESQGEENLQGECVPTIMAMIQHENFPENFSLDLSGWNIRGILIAIQAIESGKGFRKLVLNKTLVNKEDLTALEQCLTQCPLKKEFVIHLSSHKITKDIEDIIRIITKLVYWYPKLRIKISNFEKVNNIYIRLLRYCNKRNQLIANFPDLELWILHTSDEIIKPIILPLILDKTEEAQRPSRTPPNLLDKIVSFLFFKETFIKKEFTEELKEEIRQALLSTLPKDLQLKFKSLERLHDTLYVSKQHFICK